MPPTRLLTAREVCERLGVSRRLLTDLTRTGEVPSIKLGGARRYPEAELERVIAERTRQAVAAERAFAEALAQGLPERVEDPSALAQVAELLASARRKAGDADAR